ncbi:hypothetical protein JHD50_04070 [Sulfurimonas sp. MAG313]|nr:hypothetical protein [Sulfurimonas sp. MAG313]MDF1880487.1 hypothetical protein [Sulfurimonas sp. MAG313]
MAILSWSNEKHIKPPFELSFSMSYKECCEKLGKKADYMDNFKYIVNIDFTELNYIRVGSIGVVPFNNESVDESYIENED